MRQFDSDAEMFALDEAPQAYARMRDGSPIGRVAPPDPTGLQAWSPIECQPLAPRRLALVLTEC